MPCLWQCSAPCHRRHEGMQVVFLELGVGGNTPAIIKYPSGSIRGKTQTPPMCA